VKIGGGGSTALSAPPSPPTRKTEVHHAWRINADARGAYEGAKLSVDQNASKVEAKGESPKVRQYEMVLTIAHPPHEVLLSGHRLDKLDTQSAFPGKEGRRFDPASKNLHGWFLKSDFTAFSTSRSPIEAWTPCKLTIADMLLTRSFYGDFARCCS
jgi:hypothetical protein